VLFEHFKLVQAVLLELPLFQGSLNGIGTGIFVHEVLGSGLVKHEGLYQFGTAVVTRFDAHVFDLVCTE